MLFLLISAGLLIFRYRSVAFYSTVDWDSFNKQIEQNDSDFGWNVSAKDQISYDRIDDPEPYVLSGDSLKKEGVPQGKLIEGFLTDCSVYPGVAHEYRLYVPQQYDPSIPAALMVVLDGLMYLNDTNFTTVLDNLIYKKEIPATIQCH